MQFETYRVLANKDQLERAGLWTEDWKQWKTEVPNRVVRDFYSLDRAAAMYHTLRSMQLVALKNWLS